MFSPAKKTSTFPGAVSQKATDTTFFKKAGEESFFGAKENPSFFKSPVQPKLTVSTPDDPQEREADAVADKVMRMPEPVPTSPAADKKEKLDRKEEEVQPKAEAPLADRIQCKQEPEHHLQAKACNCGGHDDHTQIQTKPDVAVSIPQSGGNISLYPSDVMRQSGRGPPASSIPFEQTLASSKGSGSALPSDTRQFMESRIGADFSGVRIHTGTAAESMSRSVQAQAFAHGSDIYFNSGKYSPDTSTGKTLLAHELTHTVQQGASKSITPSRDSNSPVAWKVSRKLLASPVKDSATRDKDGSANASNRDVSSANEKVALKAENPQHTASAKTTLSNWSINASGNLHSPASAATGKEGSGKDLQKKEATEEKENLSPGSESKLQKKPEDKISAGSVSHATQRHPSPAASAMLRSTPEPGHKPSIDRAVLVNTADARTERGPPVQRTAEASGTLIQRSLIDGALARIGDVLTLPDLGDLTDPKGWFRGKVRQFASYIPGYRALGVVLGHDPVTGEEIARNGRNFLEAALDIIPGGSLLKQKLEELGILEQAAGWIDTQIDAVKGIVENVRNEFLDAWNALEPASILSGPLNIIRSFGTILERAINNIVSFAGRAAAELLDIIKKFLLSHIVDFVRNHTNAYELLKVILEHDPVTEEPVQRNGTNILNALLELGGEEGREQRKQMQETGTFQKAVGWIDRGIAVFGGLYAAIRSGFSNIWNVISIEALMNPVATFNQIYESFAGPVRQVMDFVRDALAAILGFIKEALMIRLSTWAKTVKGYGLVTVIIGKDPFTDQAVPRTVENMIHGFMSLMDGGEEQFNQMKESGAIVKAEQRVMAAVARLNMTPEYVVQLFIRLWNSFSFADLVNPVAAFQRILAQFGEPIGRLISFVIEIIRIVIEILLQVMQFPSDLIGNIIAKAMLAIEQIKRDPVGFLKNLLRAIKQGFMQFFGNIIRHLVTGLKDWFLGEVRAAGIPIPTDFTVMGIIKWLLLVLDITMEKIWKKLEERIGKEKVDKIRRLIERAEQIANAAGEAYEFIQDVKKRGFMTVIVEKIKEKLSNAWDMVLDSIKGFIMDKVISKATQKVLSMLDPTGIMAVINSAIALYKAIQSFIRYLRQMLEIVNSFVEGTLEIAKGATKRAADFLEGSLARGVPIVIGFLANQVGLDLSGSLKDTLTIVREKVDIGLTWVIGKLVGIVEKLVEMGRSAVGAIKDWWKAKFGFKNAGGERHSVYYKEEGQNLRLVIATTEMTVEQYLNEYTDKENENYKKAKSVFNEIKLIAFIPRSDLTPQQQTENRDKITKLVEALTNLSGKLSDKDYPNATEPECPSVPPSTNTVEYLVKPLKDGSKPNPGCDTGTTGWKEVCTNGLTDQSKVPDKWVQMHVITQKAGGKGLPNNLVPAPNSVNTGPFREFENNVASLANGSSNGIKNVVWFKSSVSYYSGNKYASKIEASAGIYVFKGNKEGKPVWDKDPTAKIVGLTNIPLPDLHTSIGPGGRYYSLNHDSGSVLEKIMDRGLAEVVKQNRYYNSVDDLLNVLIKNKKTPAEAQSIIDLWKSNPNIVLNNPPK